MKKTLLIATALATIAGSAFAADLPSTKAPAYLPPPPPPLWTGFYVGLNAGYTFSNTTTATVLGASLIPASAAANALAASLNANVPTNNDGFIGGGQIGYNWQYGPSILVGVEADIQGIANSGNGGTFGVGGVVPPATNTFFNVSSRIDYLGTVRGRLGWLFTPTLLLYGTGGLSYGGVSTATAISQPGAPNFGGFGASAFSDTLVGWTAGGGVEWMFWPNWSAKVEYLYYDLGTVTNNAVMITAAPPVGYAVAQTRQRFDGHVVRAGLNYHFNWGSAPVVAKY